MQAPDGGLSPDQEQNVGLRRQRRDARFWQVVELTAVLFGNSVAVGVQRESEGAVAHPSADLHEMDPRHQLRHRERVAQVVQANALLCRGGAGSGAARW